MNSRRSQLIVGSLLLIFVVAACSFSSAGKPGANTGGPAAAANPPASGGCTNAYYPTSSGTSWSYSSRGSVLGPYTYTSTVADVSDGGFTVNNLSSLGGGTSSSVKWNCQNGNLAALDAGAGSLSVSTSPITRSPAPPSRRTAITSRIRLLRERPGLKK